MTKDELRTALEAAGVTVAHDATKAELEALHVDIATPADVDVQRTRPTHMTRRQARDWSTR